MQVAIRNILQSPSERICRVICFYNGSFHAFYIKISAKKLQVSIFIPHFYLLLMIIKAIKTKTPDEMSGGAPIMNCRGECTTTPSWLPQLGGGRWGNRASLTPRRPFRERACARRRYGLHRYPTTNRALQEVSCRPAAG